MVSGGCEAPHPLLRHHHTGQELHLEVRQTSPVQEVSGRLGWGGGVLGPPMISPHASCPRYDWVTSYKVQFSNDSQTWWGSRNRSSGMEAVSGPVVVAAPHPTV